MEAKRRLTRGRPKRIQEVEIAPSAAAANTAIKKNAPPTAQQKLSPKRRLSPARSRISPVRRSSRSRSSIVGTSSSTGSVRVTPPSPIKEMKTEEVKSQPSLQETINNMPISHNIRNNPSQEPSKSSSLGTTVYTSYTSSTQKTFIRSSAATATDSEVEKITDYLRRSVSKAFEREGIHTPTISEVSRNSRSVSQSIYNDDSFSKTPEFSDNEEESDVDHYRTCNINYTSHSATICRKLETPREYGGCLGAILLLVLIPTVIYYLQWSCTISSTCKLILPNLTDIGDIHYIASIFKPKALIAFVGFNTGVFLLSAIMFGRQVRLSIDRQNQQYNFNLLPISLLLLLCGGSTVVYFKYPLADFVLDYYLDFCIYGMINAFIVAFWAFFRAKYIKDRNVQVNIYGRTGNPLVDFALGQQINPKWFGLVEFKQVFYRISLITGLLFASCFIYKSLHIPTRDSAIDGISSTNLNAIEQLTLEPLVSLVNYYYRNTQCDPAALLTSTMLFIYLMDAIVFEHHLSSSFELQSEGFGAVLLLRYAATPFVYSSVPKYFMDARVGGITCYYGIYLALAIFFTGLFIKRFSNAIKYKYRIDPNNELFRGVETIHTFQGRRLLLGSFWGRVRQPNYAGDILALCGLALPIFLRFAWPPILSISLCIVLLFHRCSRVNARNTSRYHSSWVRYCSKVQNYIIPKLF